MRFSIFWHISASEHVRSCYTPWLQLQPRHRVAASSQHLYLNTLLQTHQTAPWWLCLCSRSSSIDRFIIKWKLIEPSASLDGVLSTGTSGTCDGSDSNGGVKDIATLPLANFSTTQYNHRIFNVQLEKYFLKTQIPLLNTWEFTPRNR